MKPEAKRIAIAETCGFVFTKSIASGGVDEWHDGDGEVVHTLPNYFHNLNDMHEAEKVLDKVQWVSYCYLLRKYFTQYPDKAFGEIHATAAQRAEAFLRTLGLWQEQPQEQTA